MTVFALDLMLAFIDNYTTFVNQPLPQWLVPVQAQDLFLVQGRP